MHNRRNILALSIGAAATPAAAAAAHAPRIAGPFGLPVWPPRETVALWSGHPPGARTPEPLQRPTITGRPGDYRDLLMRGVVRPAIGVYRAPRPDGRAVVICPGGGYSFTSIRNEGSDVASALNARGITAFVLSYRLPGEGWVDRSNTPLMDVQRAMRIVRANAARYRIDPNRLGVLGFSAGGHLAASLLTLFDTPVYRRGDAIDAVSARPDFGGLMYAVSNMDPGRSHGGSRANLLGPNPDPVMERRYACDRNITRETPPLFIVHAQDDPTVPFTNAMDLFAGARAARIAVEAHFLLRGGHGFGTRLPATESGSLWPDLYDRWIGEVMGRR
ncbi:alpha/beta hydrolase [Sphingomonas sp. TREG-RG-20F-R18-01]|uniref:alpha/beta hydrolase n=1 Tax=Sphingomonas sp. TREG-RG-20F-R18-01 TaxID=2914982 RepID=UPI001F59DCE3|nr:alpha/beta hydrolase [Sphingomonas sp. TREG-RG-20F-R18-01]